METDLETVRTSEPRELLALIPHRLGFRPRDSAVLVSLRPPRGRVGLVMRVDLVHLADGGTGRQVARSALSALDADGARHVACVLYVGPDDPRLHAEPGRSAAHRAAAHVREAAEGPFGWVPVHVVTDSGFLTLDCTDPVCCPAGGRPLSELDATQVGAHMVLSGSVVAGSREELVRFPAVGQQARRSAARVRARWVTRGVEADEQAGEQREEARAAWRADSVAAWRSAVRCVEGTGPQHPAPWGRLEAGLVDRRVRDAVLVALIPGTGELAERYVLGTAPDTADDVAVREALRLVMDPAHGVRPPPDQARVHREALELVVAHGRPRRQAPALTLLAVLAWWQGEGARAQILLATALEHDATYRLARMVEDLLRSAVSPGWVRRDAA